MNFAPNTDNAPPSYWKVRIVGYTRKYGYIVLKFLGENGRVNGIIQPDEIRAAPVDQFLDPTVERETDSEFLADPSIVGQEGWVSVSLWWAESQGWL